MLQLRVNPSAIFDAELTRQREVARDTTRFRIAPLLKLDLEMAVTQQVRLHYPWILSDDYLLSRPERRAVFNHVPHAPHSFEDREVGAHSNKKQFCDPPKDVEQSPQRTTPSHLQYMYVFDDIL